MRKRKQRDSPTYLLDECFCSDLVAAKLITAGVTFIKLSEEFPRDEEDVVFLPVVGAKGWVLLTKDKEMRRDQLERETLIASKVAAFFFPAGKRTGAELADLLVMALPKIERHCKLYLPPYLARITPAGEIVCKERVRRSGIKRDGDE